MIPTVNCLFCDSRNYITDCLKIGNKQICENCFDRLIRMIEFRKSIALKTQNE